jgi:hypothetical protein
VCRAEFAGLDRALEAVATVFDLLREIAARYLPLDKVPAYIEFAKAELGEQVAIYLRPERWLTADLGPGAVPPRLSTARPATASARQASSNSGLRASAPARAIQRLRATIAAVMETAVMASG